MYVHMCLFACACIFTVHVRNDAQLALPANITSFRNLFLVASYPSPVLGTALVRDPHQTCKPAAG